MTPAPSRFARWLLTVCAPRGQRGFLLGDLDEAYRTRAARDPARARRWYRRQAVLSALLLFRFRITRSRTRGETMTIRAWLTDLRYGARALRLNPLFALTAIGTLTIGIGGTVALFSVVRAVLLGPPAYGESHQVVHLYETREDGSDRSNMSYPDVIDVRDRSQTLSGVSARQSWSPTLLGSGTPVRLEGASVNANYFNVLRVRPVAGRLFDEGDGTPGHALVVVISHRLWTERFGRDPGVPGQTLDLSGNAYEVIGVLPPDFEDTEGTLDVWRADPSFFDVTIMGRTGHSFRPMARIAPGYTLHDVNTELRQINADLIRAYPEKAGDGMVAVPVLDVLVGESREAIVLLFVAMSVLLLIACTNVANLLLGRATVRRREMAVRTALGASPRRLAGQLLTENLLLAFVGGVAGILLAVAAVPVFVGLTTAIPRAQHIAVDGWVVGFALALTAFVGVAFGVGPAWLGSHHPPAMHLRDGLRTVDPGGGWTMRSMLVVGELALSIVLLVSAGLLIRSFVALQQVETGIRTEGLLTLNISPSSENWPEHADLTRYWERVIEQTGAVPGVRRVAAVSFLPMSGGYEGQGIFRTDRPEPAPGQYPSAEARAVTSDYFQVMGIPIIRGRGFTAADDSAAPWVVVINQTLARQLFPGEDPIGKSINDVRRGAHEVVGLVGDVRQFGVQADVSPEIYAPHAQPFVPWIRGSMDLVVHTDVNPESVAASVREAVWSIDDTAPIANLKTMAQWASEDVSSPRFRTVLVGSFAGSALLLAIVGIVGVLSYAVGRRTPEFGLRAALGATPRDVLRMVMVQGGRLVGFGILAGIVISLLTARLLEGLLFGVQAFDLTTIVAVTGGVIFISLAAMLVPAVRASRVSPLVAMRAE